MQTAQEIVEAIGFAVGKTTDTMDSRIDLWQIANMAGRELFARFGWTWRTQGPVEIVGVVGQEWAPVPADFARALAVSSTNGLTPVEQVTPDRLMELRQAGVSVSGPGVVYVSFVSGSGQANGALLPTSRMDIYPTPTTAGEPSILVRYERKWKELTENDPDARPNIPDEAEQALLFKGFAIAKAIVEDDPQAFASLYEQQVARLIEEDVGRQKNFGRIRGGASYAPTGGGCSAPRISGVTFGL